MMKKITTLLCCAILCLSANAQELQFNQWQFAPSLLNPALTGAYEGTVRVGGIIKDKWGSVDPTSWKTLEAYVDAPIINGFRKQDWIGVGIAYDIDQAGRLAFNQQYQRVSAAYHFGMGTKRLKRSFSIGAQFTNGNQKVNREGNSTEQAIRTGSNTIFEQFWMQSQDGNNLETSYSAFAASFAYNAQTNKRSFMSLGLNVSQFLPSNKQNFIQQATGDLPTRFTAFFRMENKTGKRTSFEPQFVYTRQGANDKLFLQAIFGYLLKNKMTLRYGAGLNTLNDDFNIPLYVGFQKGSLRVGLAYDVDLGAIQATNTYGGLELAASYIHILAKKPEPKPVIICPRL